MALAHPEQGAFLDASHALVPLAVARPRGSEEYWEVIRDEAAELKPFEEYGLRVDIEEHVLEDTSHGLQLEDALLRSAAAWARWCLVLAITTLSLVSGGTAVVQQGTRRLVDPHWFRGASS